MILESSEQPARRRKISRVGFVLDPARPPVAAVLRLLLRFEDEPRQWYVLQTAGSAYRARYVRRAFILAVRACDIPTSQPSSADPAIAPPDAEIVTVADDECGYLAHYFADQAEQVKSRPDVEPTVRLSMAEYVLHPTGARDSRRLIWPRLTNRESLCFLTAAEYAATDLMTAAPARSGFFEAPHDALPVGSKLRPADLRDFARAINQFERRYTVEGQTWQQLYRRALASSASVPAFIGLKARLMTDSAGQSEGSPLVELLRRRHHVLLVAEAGAGKTTAVRHLAASLAADSTSLNVPNCLPIFVNLEYFRTGDPGGFPAAGLIEAIATSVAEELCALPLVELAHCTLFQAPSRRGRSKTHSTTTCKRRYAPPRTYAAASTVIREAVRAWFDNDQVLPQQLALFFDGFNRAPEHAHSALEADLVQWLPRAAFSVVTTQAARAGQLGRHFAECCLLPASTTDIDTYLCAVLPRPVYECTRRLRLANPELDAVLQLPFDLALAAERLAQSGVPERDFTSAELIDWSVTSSLDTAAAGYSFSKSAPQPHELAAFLALAAYRLVDSGAAFVRFPQDVEDKYPSIADRQSLLRAAELSGLLRSAVTPRNRLERLLGFKHELFTWYFAACYVLGLAPKAQRRCLRLMLEYLKWDRVVTMILVLARDPNDFERLFHGVAKHVPPLALNAAPNCSAIRPAMIRRALISISRNSDWASHHPDHFSRFLECAPLTVLVELYEDTTIPAFIRDQIPRALAHAYGDEALPILKEWIESWPHRTPPRLLLHSLTNLFAPEAFDILVHALDRWPTRRESLTSACLLWSHAVVSREHFEELLPQCRRANVITAILHHMWAYYPDRVCTLTKHPDHRIAAAATRVVRTRSQKSRGITFHPRQGSLDHDWVLPDYPETADPFTLLFDRSYDGDQHAVVSLIEVLRAGLSGQPFQEEPSHICAAARALLRCPDVHVRANAAELVTRGHGTLVPRILADLEFAQDDPVLRRVLLDLRCRSAPDWVQRRIEIALGLLGVIDAAENLVAVAQALCTTAFDETEQLMDGPPMKIERCDWKSARVAYGECVLRALVRCGGVEASAVIQRIARAARDTLRTEASRAFFLVRSSRRAPIESVVATIDDLLSGAVRDGRWHGKKELPSLTEAAYIDVLYAIGWEACERSSRDVRRIVKHVAPYACRADRRAESGRDRALWTILRTMCQQTNRRWLPFFKGAGSGFYYQEPT